jgi:hypothetical protein
MQDEQWVFRMNEFPSGASNGIVREITDTSDTLRNTYVTDLDKWNIYLARPFRDFSANFRNLVTIVLSDDRNLYYISSNYINTSTGEHKSYISQVNRGLIPVDYQNTVLGLVTDDNFQVVAFDRMANLVWKVNVGEPFPIIGGFKNIQMPNNLQFNMTLIPKRNRLAENNLETMENLDLSMSDYDRIQEMPHVYFIWDTKVPYISIPGGYRNLATQQVVSELPSGDLTGEVIDYSKWKDLDIVLYGEFAQLIGVNQDGKITEDSEIFINDFGSQSCSLTGVFPVMNPNSPLTRELERRKALGLTSQGITDMELINGRYLPPLNDYTEIPFSQVVPILGNVIRFDLIPEFQTINGNRLVTLTTADRQKFAVEAQYDPETYTLNPPR